MVWGPLKILIKLIFINDNDDEYASILSNFLIFRTILLSQASEEGAWGVIRGRRSKSDPPFAPPSHFLTNFFRIFRLPSDHKRFYNTTLPFKHRRVSQ